MDLERGNDLARHSNLEEASPSSTNALQEEQEEQEEPSAVGSCSKSTPWTLKTVSWHRMRAVLLKRTSRRHHATTTAPREGRTPRESTARVTAVATIMVALIGTGRTGSTTAATP